MKHFSSHGHRETRICLHGVHVGQAGGGEKKTTQQRMNPGTGAEGYYDHVAILHFVVWRRCA